MGEKLTVIRTADLGADKQAEYLNIPDETNPIMGNRGIRLCLDRKECSRHSFGQFSGRVHMEPGADVSDDQLRRGNG